jgi:hypothetical protein
MGLSIKWSQNLVIFQNLLFTEITLYTFKEGFILQDSGIFPLK